MRCHLPLIGGALIGLASLPSLLAEGAAPGPIRFEDVTTTSGVSFGLDHAPTADKRIIETMPGGLAAFDYNGDGRIDLYFTNGAGGERFDKSDRRFWNRLYRNDGDWNFTDVTAEAGVAGGTYAMGAAAADFDNDGDQDLFVAGVGRNQLFRNDGNGRFADIADAAGVAAATWSITGAWLDYDHDGLLDLFVVNYLRWSPGPQRFCGDRSRGLRVYCHPKYFEGLPNALYRNRGDGTFEDVSQRTGIAEVAGKGMSVAVLDADGDRWPDLYVTNDAVPSVLLRNTGKGGFEEIGLLAGVALPSHGRPVSAMGVDAADFDLDGRPDLAVTALSGETFPLYRNEGGGSFRDVGAETRLGALTIGRSGWGIAFADLDNDRFQDLVTANSHVNDEVERFESSAYLEPNRVFRNVGGRFEDVSAGAGEAFQRPAAHRGLVAVDLDNDGRMDVVTTALGTPAKLWRNTTVPAGRWLQVAVSSTTGPRDGIGAVVRVGKQIRRVTTATSYASSRPPLAHFGLGSDGAPPEIEVIFPDGTTQTMTPDGIDRVVVIKQP